MGAKTNPFGLSIGATVWVFGRGDTPEIVRVAGETTRSWVLSDGEKVPKSFDGPLPIYDIQLKYGAMQRYCLTRDAADALLLERARWTMTERIRTCGDVATLRKVAEALGMPTGVAEKTQGAA